MGTDIHGILQSQVDGSWVTHEQIPDDRSYLLFGILADVRGCQLMAGPIANSHGLPEDFHLDDVVRDLKIDPDSRQSHEDYILGYHDFSWLSVAEILAYPGWSEIFDSRPASHWCDWFLTYLADAIKHAPGTDHRIVFGFDS